MEKRTLSQIIKDHLHEQLNTSAESKPQNVSDDSVNLGNFRYVSPPIPGIIETPAERQRNIDNMNHNLELNVKMGKDPYYYMYERSSEDSVEEFFNY